MASGFRLAETTKRLKRLEFYIQSPRLQTSSGVMGRHEQAATRALGAVQWAPIACHPGRYSTTADDAGSKGFVRTANEYRYGYARRMNQRYSSHWRTRMT